MYGLNPKKNNNIYKITIYLPEFLRILHAWLLVNPTYLGQGVVAI
jgi:hypothetical protein